MTNRNVVGMCQFKRRITGPILAALTAVAFFLLLPAGPAAAADNLVASSISAGGSHTCAIRDSGQAVCWGDNSFGQLGDGTVTDSPAPVKVQGLPDAVRIDAGQNHTCAIRDGGQAVCWGRNDDGQLGDNSVTERHTPVNVQGLADAREISAGGPQGGGHTCAIRDGGQAVCWGDGTHGQLGDGTGLDRLAPVNVTGLTDAESISAGGLHTCAVRESGQVLCWGHSYYGQIGDGSQSPIHRLSPVPVPGLDDATVVSAGIYHTCAVRESGQAVCWGANFEGEVGDGTNDGPVLAPVDVVDLDDAVSIETGDSFTCAVRADGSVACWGRNGHGQLGDGTTDSSYVPVPVEGLPDGAGQVSTGDGHTCAVEPSGQVVCWGSNGDGQLGNGTTSPPGTPNPVPGPVIGIGETVNLTVTRSGNGQGTVTSRPAGIACGSDCSEPYDTGTRVRLTATAGSGSVFTGWTGACSGGGSCVVTMDQARSVNASFVTYDPDRPPLVVSRGGSGTGRVTGSPGVIDCGPVCSDQFNRGTVVTLTATADPGSVFTGWNGACEGTARTCRVVMDRVRLVSADFSTFDSGNPPLVVFRTGGGQGSVTSSPAGIDCGPACTAEFARGTVVTLTATPAPGSVFTGFNGACTGTGRCQVTMDRARSVWASFSTYDPDHPPLTVFRVGDGAGRVVSTPAGIDCGDTCSAEFDRDSTVTLRATPAAGSAFMGWNGACTGTGKTCDVKMSRVRSVWAAFSAVNSTKPSLMVFRAGDGQGSVTSSPAGIECSGSGEICHARFDKGTEVTLVAATEPGSVFMGWNGACTGTGACRVTMDQARSVWATFSLVDPDHPPLAVFRAGSGQGTVKSSPAGIECGNDCLATFNRDAVVTLTASPAAGSEFTGFSGACSGAATTCRVTMSKARSVWASFARAGSTNPKDDSTATYDPVTGRLAFRLKCTARFRPRCRKMVAQAVTGRRKRAKKMSSRVRVRNRKAGRWKLATLRVKPRFRKKVERMGRVKRKTLWVRIKVTARVKKKVKVRRNGMVKRVRRKVKIRRTVHHRYIVRVAS